MATESRSTTSEVSVVIPVKDERDNVEPLAAELGTALRDYRHELLFVDDGSSDGTFEILRRLAVSQRDGSIRVIRLRRNYGQSAAMLAGIEQSRGSIIATLDGDRQNDPADIPRMISQLARGYDLIHGWAPSAPRRMAVTSPPITDRQLADSANTRLSGA